MKTIGLLSFEMACTKESSEGPTKPLRNYLFTCRSKVSSRFGLWNGWFLQWKPWSSPTMWPTRSCDEALPGFSGSRGWPPTRCWLSRWGCRLEFHWPLRCRTAWRKGRKIGSCFGSSSSPETRNSSLETIDQLAAGSTGPRFSLLHFQSKKMLPSQTISL